MKGILSILRIAALVLIILSLAGCASAPATSMDIEVPLATDAAGSALPYLVVPGANASPAQTVSPLEPSVTAAPLAVQPSDTLSPEESPTQEPTQEPTQAPTQEPTQAPDTPATGTLPYYLYVEKESFTLTIYALDSNGQYTTVYKTYRIAHGGNKTPAGVFTLGDERERWHDFPDGGTAQYATLYKKHLYIHSPLYGGADPGMLWPKYYDGELGIGKASTGGCLRMVTEAAKFIYENCPEGTVLEIVNGAPRGTTSPDVPSRNGKRIDPTDEEGLKND